MQTGRLLILLATAAACGTSAAADNESLSLPGKGGGGAGDTDAGTLGANLPVQVQCTDGAKDGAETDVDCGGPGCPPCAVGKACKATSDCARGTCRDGRCAASANGDECTASTECGASATCMDGICCAGGAPATLLGTWTRGAPMTMSRYYPAAVQNRGYVYVIGGKHYEEGAGSPDVAINERYDPATDTWTTRAPMPKARLGVAAISLGGLVHVLSSTDHWVYDPSADAWSTRGALPSAVVGAAVVDGTLHALTTGNGHVEWTSSDDTWKPRPAPPTALTYPLLASVSGKMIGVTSATTQIYDPSSNAWVTKAKVPTGRSVISGSFQTVIDGAVLVAGGGTAATEAYDPMTDKWVALKPGPARDAMGTTVLCGRLYAIGGSTPGYSYTLNDVYNLR